MTPYEQIIKQPISNDELVEALRETAGGADSNPDSDMLTEEIRDWFTRIVEYEFDDREAMMYAFLVEMLEAGVLIGMNRVKSE